MPWSRRDAAIGGGIAVLVLAAAAAAAEAADSIWDHNGSEMLWEADGDTRTVSYLVPRQGLSVQPGTVLFEGERVGDLLEGTARTFRQGCPPAEYAVSGRITSETTVVLTGAAPVRAATGCEITGYSTTSSNAVLEFTYLRAAEASVPGQDIGVAAPDTLSASGEESVQDQVGQQVLIIPLSSAAEIWVWVETGVASHVMPDMVSASIRCGSGSEHALIQEGRLNVCAVDDVSVRPGDQALVIEASRYNQDTAACEPQQFEYSYAGYCR